MDKDRITLYLIRIGVTLFILMCLSVNLFLWFDWLIVVKIIVGFIIPLALVFVGLNWSTKEIDDAQDNN